MALCQMRLNLRWLWIWTTERGGKKKWKWITLYSGWMLVHSVIVNLYSPTPKVEQSAEWSWLVCHLSLSLSPSLHPPPEAHIFPVLKISDKTSEPKKCFNAKRKLCTVCGWMHPSPHVCVRVCAYTCLSAFLSICERARPSYSRSRAYTLSISVCVRTYCKCLRKKKKKKMPVCVFVRLWLFVCPSLLGKVIHHSKHQMTSPPTPILQLLPFHPPHILHSDGLAGCHHPPSSSSSSSSSSTSSSCPAFNSTLLLR